MPLRRVESFARSSILLTLSLMVALDLWFTLSSVTTIASSEGTPDAIEFVSILFVFLVVPLLVLASDITALRYQLRTVGAAYLLFALSIAEHFTIIMSWGVHAFAMQSVMYGLVAASLAAYIFYKAITSNAERTAG